MRCTTFLSIFLLALLSVLSFAVAEPVPAASLAARDPTDTTPIKDTNASEDGRGNWNCNAGYTPCADNYYGWCCKFGYGVQTAFVDLLLTQN
jgi:hypothetical protein